MNWNEGLTLDQLAIFAIVVEAGSFSGAARRLNRAQSAITYAIQGLEAQTGTPLFDRTGYRPVLTVAGRILLPRAQRVVESVAAYRHQAQTLSAGLEAQVILLMDVFFPDRIVETALAAFNAEFPSVQLVILTRSLGSSLETLLGGGVDLGVMALPIGTPKVDSLYYERFGEVSLTAVAAPAHPLARFHRTLSESDLRDYTQLVLSSSSTGDDQSVYAVNRWRIHDLHVRHRLILGGVGWGGMPIHMVADDVKERRLVALKLETEAANAFDFKAPLAVLRLKDRVLGPAGQWLFDCLISEGRQYTANIR